MRAVIFGEGCVSDELYRFSMHFPESVADRSARKHRNRLRNNIPSHHAAEKIFKIYDIPQFERIARKLAGEIR